MKFTIELETPDDIGGIDLDRSIGSISFVRRMTILAKQHDATQPPAQAEPKLEKPATVGAFTFNAGVSERLVIEAAQRQYEYSQQPEQIEAREKRLRGFIKELHQAEPSPDTEQQRRDALMMCRTWFERYSPTAELIGDLGHGEHPMLTMLNGVLAGKSSGDSVNQDQARQDAEEER